MPEITTEQRMAQLEADVKELKVEQSFHARVLFGDQRAETPGALKRIGTLETLVENMEEERKTQKNLIRGIALGLGLTGIGSVGTFITVLTQIGNTVKP